MCQYYTSCLVTELLFHEVWLEKKERKKAVSTVYGSIRWGVVKTET